MKSLIFVLILFTSTAFANQKHGPTDEQIERMAKHNSGLATVERALGFSAFGNVKPFYEYDKTGYVVMADGDYFGIAREMKKQIAQNLPEDATLIIYTQSTSKAHHQQLFNTYSSYIPKERLKIVQVPRSGSNDFWSRDNTPVPVWNLNGMGLVDARYYYNFEPDAFFRDLFRSPLDRHNYFFEGGNFTANALGDCVVVNRRASYPGGDSDTAAIPDEVFRSKYGCTRLIRLRHIKGIGHSDEVVKFISDKIILTDTREYIPTLEAAGFTVVELPEPERPYETYVNSLIVNNVIFVPVFGERGDQLALDTYKSLLPGHKIVPINSRNLSTQGQGSIHCITMNYPPVPIGSITALLKAQIVLNGE